MKRIFLPSADVSDWQKLASKPGRQWKRGFSAEAASTCWEAAGDRLPPEITAAFDSSTVPELRELKLLAAIPKWQTHLPDDKRPSTTDILAVARNDDGLCVISVEARENENFGPVVAERLTRRNGQINERLRFLQDFLSLPSVDPTIRYELLFRAASALVAARQFFASTAVMLIHSFGIRPELRAEFDRFCDAMRASDPGSGVRAVKSFAKPRLILAWVDGDRRFASPYDTRPRPEGIVTVTFGPCCCHSDDTPEDFPGWGYLKR